MWGWIRKWLEFCFDSKNTNISAASPSADVTISGNGNLTIQSVLKKTASSQPGNLSGAAVMEISIP